MPAHTLPQRFRPEAVTRYWPHIQAMINSWPTPIKLNPAPLSIDTFTCRLRDAITAIMVHNQGTDNMRWQLKDIAHNCMVKQTPDGAVIFGNKHRIKAMFKSSERVQAGSVIDAKVALADKPVQSPSQIVLTSIFVLLEHSIIEHVTIDGVEENVLKHYISQCNRPLELVQSTKTGFTLF